MATSSLDWGAEAEKEEKEMTLARKVTKHLIFLFWIGFYIAYCNIAYDMNKYI